MYAVACIQQNVAGEPGGKYKWLTLMADDMEVCVPKLKYFTAALSIAKVNHTKAGTRCPSAARALSSS